MKRFISIVVLVLCGFSCWAQTPAQSWGVLDMSGCGNGVTPTQTNLDNSMFGTFASATTYNVVNGGSTFNCATGNIYPWLTAPSLNGTSWPNNSTTSIKYSYSATENQAVTMSTTSSPTYLSATSGSVCQEVEYNIPQNASSWGRSDGLGIYGYGGTSDFLLLEPQGNGTRMFWDMEAVGANGSAGGGTAWATNNTLPSSTPFIICEQFNHTGHDYIGIWNSSGTFLSGSLAMSVAQGGYANQIQAAGVGAGAQPIPSGDSIIFGSLLFEGIGLAPSNSEFPQALGLQLLPALDTVSSANGTVNATNSNTGCGSNYLVTWASGATFNSGWTFIYIPSIGVFTISSVLSSTSLCIVGQPGSYSSVAYKAGGGGTYSSPVSVTMAGMNSDSPNQPTIVYTLDGSTPTCANGSPTHGTTYSGSIMLYITTTINEMACLTLGGGVAAYANSTITTSTYTIGGTGLLAPARAMDWTQVGANPGSAASNPLPDASWTQTGSTISACGTSGSPVSPATCGITSALSFCANGEYVLLAAGNFYLNAGLNAGSAMPNQCEIRGAGANSTFLHFTGESNCNGTFSEACLAGSNNYAGGEQNHATWTADFTQGSTTIVLSNSLNIVANSTFIILDQGDLAADTGQIWNNINAGTGTNGGAARTDNTCSTQPCLQQEYHLVTGCSPSCNNSGSTTVTLATGLVNPNWASANSTGAWWATTRGYQQGIRDLSMDLTSTTNGTTPIVINNGYENFVYQVRTISGARNHVGIQYSAHSTVQNNYFYGEQSGYTGTSSYAVEIFGGSDNLIANNIFQQVVTGPTTTGGGTGNVVADNFEIDSVSTGSAALMTPMNFVHAGGESFALREGDFTNGVDADDIHGTRHFVTYFRNGIPGWAASGCNGSPCSVATTALYLNAGSRYFNFTYNVLGQSSYHTTLSLFASGNCSPNWLEEYIVGCSDVNAGTGYLVDPTNPSGSTTNWDVLTNNSLMAYDNYDIVSAASHSISTASAFNDATGSPSTYIGLSSPGTAPASLIYSSAPSYWQSVSWPAIGPDVTGGNLLLCSSGATYAGSYVTNGSTCGGSNSSAYAGHANASPAMNCALNVMSMPADGSGSVLAFNPSLCYGGASAPNTNGAPTPAAFLAIL